MAKIIRINQSDLTFCATMYATYLQTFVIAIIHDRCQLNRFL